MKNKIEPKYKKNITPPHPAEWDLQRIHIHRHAATRSVFDDWHKLRWRNQ